MKKIVSTRSIVRKAKSRPVVAACTAALTITAVGGVASAAIPSAGNVIRGCYQPSSSYVRVVDADAARRAPPPKRR